MKEPKAVEIVKSDKKANEWEVRGYWEGDNRAGDDVTFAERGKAVRWAKENGFIVCTRNAKLDGEYWQDYSAE